MLYNFSFDAWSIFHSLVTLLQVFAAAVSFSTETNPQTQAQYSKFFSAKKNENETVIHGRTAMLIIYTPSFLISAFLFATENSNVTRKVVACLLMIHFLKRVLETLFVHKYSNQSTLGTASFISVFYSMVCLMILHFQATNFLKVSNEHYSSTVCYIGYGLFLIGSVGNLYHHILLANLRNNSAKKDDDKMKYKIPVGGFFTYVTCPHYFFELAAWLGIALVAQQLNAFLVFCSMTSYLAGRAFSTTKWYKDNMKNYPVNRKNLIPFVF